MKTIDICIIVLLIFAGLAAYPFLAPYMPKPQQSQADKPPMVVALDVSSFIAEAIKQDPDGDPTSLAINNVNNAALELAGKGYIVLHGDSVLAAPEGYKLTPFGSGGPE